MNRTTPVAAPGTSPAHEAGEVQALFAEWISLTEAAITALDTEDTEGMTSALHARAELMPGIQNAVAALRASGASLPVSRIAADLEASEVRLAARVQQEHTRVRQELGSAEHAGAAATAYRQFSTKDLTALNLKG